MSVRVPKMHAHIDNPYGDDEGDVVYSYVASNSQMDSTIQEMEELLPDLLRLAEIEKPVSSWRMRLKNAPSGQWTGVCDHSRPQRDHLLYRNETPKKPNALTSSE